MSTQSNGLDLEAVGKSAAEMEDEGIVVELKGADGELITFTDGEGVEKPVTMTIVGSYSERYRRINEAQTTKALKRRGMVVTGELLNRQRLDLVAGCVLRWEGFFRKGQPLLCDRENVRAIFVKFPWIREQMEAAMEDHEAFFRANSSN